jgi:triphosphoribosyl-dephospho-CoA synthetase
MNLIWKPMAFAKGETAMFNNTKLGIIRHRGSVWAAYVGNRKLEDSKSKKEALKRILEEIDIQGRLF